MKAPQAAMGTKRRRLETADGPASGKCEPLEVECFYSLSSPWMYFGGPQLEDIVRRHRVKLVLKPFDFQAVAPESGGIPLRTRPEPRKTYHAEELARWRDYLGMPLNLQPAHYKPNFSATQAVDPNWNKYAGWMVIAAQHRGEDAFLLSHALLRALWAEDRDTSDPAVRIAVANENGFDGAALQALESADATQETYAKYTREARDKGVFGAPTFIVGHERFWGQDRLLFVDRKLGQMQQKNIAEAAG
mmetsp:Transcript_50773/g.128001  ORF Transcript_50773/g.128001 Transcript_50773/m.128001 type:complete len:247 (+) Transcript_50773:25-765(+)